MKQFETDIVKMRLEDGILCTEHISKEIISLEQAKAELANRLKYIGPTPYPILADFRNGKGATTEAQMYVLKEDAKIGTPAIAIIVGSLVSRLFGNLVLNVVNSTEMDVRLFLDETHARNWLEKYTIKKKSKA